MSDVENPSLLDSVMSSLENEKYEWRTVRGISKELGVSSDEVEKLIKSHADQIVQSSILSSKGEELFTTRNHFNKNSGITGRIFGAWKGKV